MQRFVSVLSALALAAFFIGTSGCPGPAKELKFDKTSKDVEAGKEVIFTADKDSGKITKAELAKEVKGVKVMFTDKSVTVKADKDAAATKDVEVNVVGEGNKKATLKVTVTVAAVVVPPPAAKDLKFDKMSQDVKAGEEVKFMATEGVVTGAEGPKDAKLLTVTCKKDCVKVAADKTAKAGTTFEIAVKGEGDKTAKLTVKVVAADLLPPPPVAKELKFAPAAPEVKQGQKTIVKVSDGKATKASAPDGSKVTAKVIAAGAEIEISADAVAPVGNVVISIEGGDKAAKLTVKVTAGDLLPPPPPAATELKFKKDVTTQDVNQGAKYVFEASSKSVKITGAKLAKAEVKGLKVSNDDKSVTVEVAADAAVADNVEITVTGEGNKTLTLKVNVKKKS